MVPVAVVALGSSSAAPAVCSSFSSLHFTSSLLFFSSFLFPDTDGSLHSMDGVNLIARSTGVDRGRWLACGVCWLVLLDGGEGGKGGGWARIVHGLGNIGGIWGAIESEGFCTRTWWMGKQLSSE